MSAQRELAPSSDNAENLQRNDLEHAANGECRAEPARPGFLIKYVRAGPDRQSCQFEPFDQTTEQTLDRNLRALPRALELDRFVDDSVSLPRVVNPLGDWLPTLTSLH